MSDDKSGMKDYFKKSIFVGLGLATMTKDKIQSFAKEVSDYTKMSEEEGEKFAEQLTEESEKAQQRLEAKVNRMIEEAKERIPGMKRLREIEERLDVIEARLNVECAASTAPVDKPVTPPAPAKPVNPPKGTGASA